MAIPKPVTKTVECSACGLDWKLHKSKADGKVTLDECVRLLKAELAKPRMSYPIYMGASGSGYQIQSPISATL